VKTVACFDLGCRMTRLICYLTDGEWDSLQRMADQELRSARDQARHIIRRELERAGLLAAEPSPTPAQTARAAEARSVESH